MREFLQIEGCFSIKKKGILIGNFLDKKISTDFVYRLIKSKPESYFLNGIKKCRECLDKCVAHSRNNVEK